MSVRQKYAELHLHSMDQFDADNKPDAVCRRLQELGAEGFCLTQHGVLSAIEPMRECAAKYGLKFVPGIEAYYGNEEDLKQNKHLLLLSVNIDGYHAICKAVSDPHSQNKQGRAVLNENILNQYFGPGSKGHGNVIATSACISGVLGAIIRINETIENEIQKLSRKMEKYGHASELCEEARAKLEELDAELARKTAERDEIRPVAEMKFARREQYVSKLQKEQDPVFDEEMRQLERDKQSAAAAQLALTAIKAEITRLKKSRTLQNKTVKDLSDKAKKEAAILEQIRKMESSMLSEEEILSRTTEEARKMQNIFGKDNFYVEIQNHGMETEALVYPKLVQVAEQLRIPLVATNDVHMVTNAPEELLKRRILKAMRYDQWEEDGVGQDQLYIKTDAEMVQSLRELFPEDVVSEAMANIRAIFDRCNVVFTKETHYPTYPTANGLTAEEVLWTEIQKGATERFPDGLPEAYQKRLQYEYGIITKMGYADYHLIVKDFLDYGRALAPVPDEEVANAPLDIQEVREWVRNNGWVGGFTIGPGRGSAVGSLVCYCLGITSLDPIKYGLLFERFLNPERVSMPDIDSDMANSIREQVIRYVRHKYGEEAVCGIMTTNAQAPKGALRIAAKYYGQAQNKPGQFLALGDKLAKFVPAEPGISFHSEYGGTDVEQAMRKEFSGQPDALAIIDWAKTIEGCFTAYGAHAAGIVISDGAPVSDYIPLKWNEKLGEMTTQVDMIRVEENGLLKFDFLGLRTLNIITDCIRMLYQSTGVLIEPLSIPMDDANVFEQIFHIGRTDSVFQFESTGMKSMLKQFRPDTFEDLIILVSMYRPGPLQYLDDVIRVKTGQQEMSFLCPELKPILGKTYGAIVYQEQVMEIFQKLAGYTLGGADNVRRFMSKKKMDKLAAEREAFIHGDPERNIEGCVSRGIAEDAAVRLFDQMTEFAKYAFNKSHAAAYAAISYYTAYLKFHYPAQFLAAALKWSPMEKYAGLILEAKSFRIPVLGPDINASSFDFAVTAENAIRFGLSAVKGVGAEASALIRERSENGPFISLDDFFTRTEIRKNAVENLIRAGAMDAFHKNREELLSIVEPQKTVTAKIRAKSQSIEHDRALLLLQESAGALMKEQKSLGVHLLSWSETTEKESKIRARIERAEEAIRKLKEERGQIAFVPTKETLFSRLQSEKELTGTYLSAHPLDEYEVPEAYGASAIRSLAGGASADTVMVLGVVNKVTPKLTKAGKPIAFLDVEDLTGSIKCCLFSYVYPKCRDMCREGQVLLFKGRFMMDSIGEEEIPSLNVQSVERVFRHCGKLMVEAGSWEAYKRGEQIFRERFEDKTGMECLLFDKSTGKVQKLPFRVSESLKNIKGVHVL